MSEIMDDQKQINEQHLFCPEPGDYWHENFVPACVVIEASSEVVTLCNSSKDVDSDRWTWDLSKIQTLAASEFRQWLSDGYSLPDTWATCEPGAHKWMVDEVKKMNKAVPA